MACPSCQGDATQELDRTTALGYRLFRCRPCRRTFNARTGTPFNHLQVDMDARPSHRQAFLTLAGMIAGAADVGGVAGSVALPIGAGALAFVPGVAAYQRYQSARGTGAAARALLEPAEPVGPEARRHDDRHLIPPCPVKTR